LSFIAELKRRNVFRVGVAYLIGAWLLIQVADILLDNIDAPAWVLQIIFVVLLVGFFIALFLAWVFEVTPEGVKRDSMDVSDQPRRMQSRQKLNIAIVVLLMAAVAYLLVDKFFLASAPIQEPEITVSESTVINPEGESAPEEDKRPSIAVLPFNNRSKLEDDVFFVEGIHDDLLTNLARIGDLKVISRTTVSQYASTDKTLPEIAAELDVAHIMEGAVQRSGDTVRINVQLIRADTDEHVWAEIFDRQLTAGNLFAIQSEISGQIARTLKSALTPEEQKRINDRPTENLAAYNAYLRGRQELARYSSAGADQSLVEFRQAVELDPNFALAWASLARSALQGLFLSDMNRDEALEITREAANRAIALNDQIAEAHLARAALIGLERATWVPEYEEALLRAIELGPGLAYAWYQYSQFLSGRNTRKSEALVAAQRAAELDPLSTSIRNRLIQALAGLGRFQEAEQQLDNLIQLDDTFAINYVTMSDLKSDQGDYAEALRWRRKAQQRDPGNIMFQLGEVWPLTSLGLEGQYQDLIDRVEKLDPNSSTLALLETLISIRQGNLDAAVEAANAWVRLAPPGDTGKHLWKAITHMFRGEIDIVATEAKLALGDPPNLEDMLGLARDVPERACMIASMIHEAIDADMGTEISRAVLEQVDHKLLDHQRRQLNLNMSICHLVLGDREGALTRIEQAVEDGQLDGWWFTLNNPLIKTLEFEPRYQDALQRIESAMTEQRERFLKFTPTSSASTRKDSAQLMDGLELSFIGSLLEAGFELPHAVLGKSNHRV
jgi:TolB-like protein